MIIQKNKQEARGKVEAKFFKIFEILENRNFYDKPALWKKKRS